MARKKKFTAAQEAAFDAEREARLVAFEAFRARFDGVIFKARVLWFDASSGEGSVRGLNGEGTFGLYACNIPGTRTWYPETACVTHAEGQVIDVELKVSYGCSILVSHTPGTLDKAKWDALDQSKLAFKCNEAGEPVNGLFAPGAGL